MAVSDLNKTGDPQKPYGLLAASAAAKIDPNQGHTILAEAIKAFNDLDKELDSGIGLREDERKKLTALRKQANLSLEIAEVAGPPQRSCIFSLRVPGVAASFREAVTAASGENIDAFGFVTQFDDGERELQLLAEALQYTLASKRGTVKMRPPRGPGF